MFYTIIIHLPSSTVYDNGSIMYNTSLLYMEKEILNIFPAIKMTSVRLQIFIFVIKNT